MARLFVGLELDPPLLGDIAAARGGVEGAHWQRDNQLHLTLAFIGDASRKTKLEIEDALARIRFEPFDMVLSGVGMFGKPKQPKVLWAGVDNKKPLMHLHEKIAMAMAQIDVDIDRRKFKPHITLARFRRGAHARVGDWLTENERLSTRSMLVDRFVLFSSERTSEGSFYRHEAEFHADGFEVADNETAEDHFLAEWALVGAS